MRQISFAEWQAELEAQGTDGREHKAFVCPTCGTVQSMAMLRAHGVPDDKVEGQIGFSCVGRWTDAGEADFKKGQPRKGKVGCNWTLGGLFRLHKLEVTGPDGTVHPMFEIAPREAALELERTIKV